MIAMIAETVFSPDRAYRYVLVRRWSTFADKPRICCYIMLNPSTADEAKNDPTVERCERRARDNGYDGLCVLNLFAYRSTAPKVLYEIADPVGPDNDAHIIERAKACKLVVCGWGTHGALHDRGHHVLDMLHANGVEPHALAFNGDGSPRHPLYVPYGIKPVSMRWKT